MTLKKAKSQYAKVIYHIRKLQRALNEAHESKLLVYQDFAAESPCKLLYELEKRFEKTTKDAVARAFDAEVNSEYWAKHS